MSCEELIEELRARNVELVLESGQLRYRAPKGALSPELRRALEERRSEIVARLEQRRDEPAPAAAPSTDGRAIAVIGMACRFPKAPDLAAFWRLLRDGVDAIGQPPVERRAMALNVLRYYVPSDPATAEATEAGLDFGLRGGWIEGSLEFDPLVFGISPREARNMSPEQRIALEVSWEALEHAGYAGDTLVGSRTGVFLGSGASHWGMVAISSGLDVSGMIATQSNTMVANRTSYHLNLCGPSLTVDTACSSSLFAVHLARQAMLAGDCDLALVGGVNLLLDPVSSLALARAGMLARDGRCKAFDAGADGYVRGEGVGVVVLKRLEHARRDGDRVYGVIRGSAVNHDGHSKIGLLAPSPKAQRDLLLQAYADAGVDPATVTYVEAHGTGTNLGDPVEIDGLTQAFRTDRRRFCAIGTVKTNVGHLELAAGIASLIKVLLSLENKQIPPSLNFQTPNPHIRFEETPFEVNTTLREWISDGPRRAGVSSFGFGGANAHLVLEEAGATPPAAETAPRARLLPLSARTPSALARLVERYRDYLAADPAPLGDVCFTASVGRAQFEYRLAIVASSIAELRAILDALPAEASGAKDPAEVRRGFAPRSSRASSRRPPPPADADAAARRRALTEVAAAWVAGEVVDWRSLYTSERPRRAALPTYPFERQRFWLDGPTDADTAPEADEARPPEHPEEPDASGSKADAGEGGGTVKPELPQATVADQEAPIPTTAPPAGAAVRVVCQRAGSLAELGTRDEARPASIGAGAVEIEVRATGLNFMDLLGVLDATASSVDQLGAECAGVVVRVGEGVSSVRVGDPVIAIAHGSFATHVTTLADLVVRMPSGMSFEDAATIPIAFLTADYALRHEAQLRAGERVLIHSAAGGVGLAALQIAQRIGAQVVATAGNDEKRQLLRERGVEHVFDSHEVHFAPAVRAATGGEGVDVVLNSLAGDAIAEGLAALRPYGRFVEIGKTDIRRNAALPLGSFTNCLRYVAVDLQRMCLDRRDFVRSMLSDLVARFEAGELRPLPLRAFAFRDAEAAFRHMARRKNVGKLILVPEAGRSDPRAAEPAAPAADEGSPAVRVGDAVQKHVPKLKALYGLERYEDFGQAIDRAAVAFVWEALCRLGWSPRPGERFGRTALAERLGIQATFERLVRRSLGMLVEEGVLTGDGEQFQVSALPRFEAAGAQLARLLETYPAFDAELGLLGRCGAELADVLAGRSDPVQLLFPDGRLDHLEALYQDAPASRFFNSLTALAVEQAVCHGDGEVRILELGAGTGSTTASILPKLPGGRSEYVYTDVSKLFLRHGKRKFENYKNVRYELLDAEADPRTQGFGAASFDLVVAANVLHATADLRRSLEHVRTVLRPGGWLVLLEMTRPTRWLDIVFGLLAGWRKFQDDDVRHDTPLLGAGAWADVLRQAGFAEVATVPRGTAGKDPGQALIVARLPGALDARVEATATPESKPESPAQDMSQWFYELRWESKRRPEMWRSDAATLPMREGRWLIFDDGEGLGQSLASLLRKNGNTAVLVAPTSGGEMLDLEQGRACVAPDRPQSMRALVDRLGRAGGPPLRGVLYLWSAAAGTEDDGPAALDAAQTRGAVGVLSLVQALGAQRWTEPPRLWIATRGAQVLGTGSTPASIGQAPIWGLTRGIALEHPELRCVRVDLDPEPQAEEAQALLEEVRFEEFEDQVAFRGAERHVLRLVRMTADAFARRPDAAGAGNGHGGAHHDLAVRADGTYLVTGGLGGLGLVVAEWLVGRGARHLVLVGRRGATEGSRSAVERMTAVGAKVLIAAADVTNERQVDDVLARIGREMPPLRGVIHAAGVLDDGVLLEIDEQRLRDAMAPKVRGAWNLHAATSGASLDFFVLFSSMVSVLGTRGQANYAAANAYMDALAQYRRSQGQTALSINWGPWSEVGLASGEERGRWLALGGIESISPMAGCTVLELLLGVNPAQVGVLSVNWRRWRQLQPGASESPVLADLVAEEAVLLPKMTAEGRESRLTRKALVAAPPEERWAMLENYLRERVAEAFEMSVSSIDSRIPLTSMGLESLTAVEVRNEIERDIGVSVSMADFVDGPSIADLATRLLDQITGEESGRGSARPAGSDGEWEEFTL